METLTFIVIFLFIGHLLVDVETFDAQHFDQTRLRKMAARTMIRVESSPILVDYALLRRDFPEQLSALSDEQIREWLLDHASYFREGQIVQNQAFCDRGSCIHGPLTALPAAEQRRGLVSKMMGRSAFSPVSPSQFLDLKGSGTDDPQPFDIHSNGVLTLTTAIHEFMMSKIVRRIGQIHEEPFDSIDCYAVLHVPAWHRTNAHSSMVHGNNTPPGELINSPAIREDIGIAVRQAATRPSSNKEYLAPLEEQIRFERALRSHGMTAILNFYNEVYPRDDAAVRADFSFFDAQMTKPPTAFIDFSNSRIVPPAEAMAARNQPVYSLADLFFNEKTKRGCVAFNNGEVLRNESDCREHLEGCKPHWRLPLLARPSHALSPGQARWYDFHRDDFSAWFEEPLRSEIYKLTFQSGPVFALQEDPQIYQTIFNRLSFLLKQWSTEEIDFDEMQAKIIFHG